MKTLVLLEFYLSKFAYSNRQICSHLLNAHVLLPFIHFIIIVICWIIFIFIFFFLYFLVLFFCLYTWSIPVATVLWSCFTMIVSHICSWFSSHTFRFFNRKHKSTQQLKQWIGQKEKKYLNYSHCWFWLLFNSNSMWALNVERKKFVWFNTTADCNLCFSFCLYINSK